MTRLQYRLAAAMNAFEAQHGSEMGWSPQEVTWHDDLMQHVREEYADEQRHIHSGKDDRDDAGTPPRAGDAPRQ